MPLSLVGIPSPPATAVVPTLVSPSATTFISAPVAFKPVTLADALTNALIALADASVSSLPDTESKSVSIDAILLNKFNCVAVDVTAVPPINSLS